MRKRRATREETAEVNMTPMLDIVFILLIFFIVTATFLNEEGINLTPPPDTPTPPCADCPPPIVVQIDASNAIFVNGVRTDVDRVISAVNRFRAEAGGSAVLIEAHDRASHGIIVRIWDDMGANGIPTALQRSHEEAGGARG